MTESTTFDPTVFNVIKISPEDIANQITILDWAVFQRITPDELESCAWNGSKKLEITPRVVDFTRRANQTNFWCQHEILGGKKAKTRADIISHIVKIAKHLEHLQNYHGLFAIMSACCATPIFNLKKTWSHVRSMDKGYIEKLKELYADEGNYGALRSILERAKLPCIPYLGMYQKDLFYIDTAHPPTGGLESHERSLKMNNVLRVVSEFQRSEYSTLTVVEHVRDYITLAFKYIEELQKFVEEDFYAKSVKLEPSSASRASADRSRSANNSPSPLHVSRHRAAASSLQRNPTSLHDIHRPSKGRGHKRNQSFQGTFPSGSAPNLERNLIDDSQPEAPQSFLTTLPGSSSKSPDATSYRSNSSASLTINQSRSQSSIANSLAGELIYEGIMKKKVVLKMGEKPSFSRWRTVYVVIRQSTIFFYGTKPLSSARLRGHFYMDPFKQISLAGWLVTPLTDDRKPNQFLLHNINGYSYRFQCSDSLDAEKWVESLKHAIRQATDPGNLITFDERTSPCNSSITEEPEGSCREMSAR